MTESARTRARPAAAIGLTVDDAAALTSAQVLSVLGSAADGLTADEAVSRLASVGPNAVLTHHAKPWLILARQLNNAVLVLLAVTAGISFFLGQRTDTTVIGVILLASIGLGFVNEYRAERATEALHSQVSHRAVVLRGGRPVLVDVTSLVPGDVVRLELGQIVPADLRLLHCTGLECDESVMTGESLPVAKAGAAVPAGTPLGDLTSCALMGTVVHGGNGQGVVVATGSRAEFGRIASGLGDRQPETDFQVGLRAFSVLLLQVAIALTTMILITNLALHRPLIESLLFSLAIAVGITPQLLPAVVSTSLATGCRRLAQRKVLVKRLVCIEDLGDMDVLVTDKTGTLTEGRITFTAAMDPSGATSTEPLLAGLLATEAEPGTEAGTLIGGNPLDAALWAAPDSARVPSGSYVRLGLLPFDHERQMTSAVVRAPDGSTTLVVKGAPESVLDRCVGLSPAAATTLRAQFEAGSRVVAVASRDLPREPEQSEPAGQPEQADQPGQAVQPGQPAQAGQAAQPGQAAQLVDGPGLVTLTAADETGLSLIGFLVFLDRPKPAATAALERLATLGIAVKICTGDNALVAEKVCADLGLVSGGTLTGTELTAMDDATLAEAAAKATIFARVSPEQKARLVKALRKHGRAVGFLGDGVNDALALHAADVGISVDTATDVAKDAADIVLLEKDLGVVADGVAEGRRIFANTIKYVLMGTSSNFGNMFSAAAASAVLSFLPMLPSQILLNNLLYDASQLTIPTDRVDPEQLQAPSHWDIGFIRRFMLYFGPISSLFDFLTFALMLGIFHAGPELFRAGWFAESLATQTLVIFAIRTRRSPFTRSRPSRPLLLASLGTVAVGVAIPLSPLAPLLGFVAPPAPFFLALAGMVVAYLVLIELAKRQFFAHEDSFASDRPAERRRGHRHRVQRRAARFSVAAPLPDRTRRR